MKIEGIIFDKDGTLIDFYKVWGSATEPVIRRIFDFYGIKDSDKNRTSVLNGLGISDGKIDPDGALAWKTYPMIARDLIPVLEQITESKSIHEDILAMQLSSFYEEEIKKEFSKIKSFTDLPGLMRTLQKKKIRIGIATTDTYEATKQCMNALRIMDYISFLSADQMPICMPTKPDGKIIQMAAECWKIDTENIIVVGDTPNDMCFAHNGGAVAVGVLSGTGRERDLNPVADYVIESVDKLPQLLSELERH